MEFRKDIFEEIFFLSRYFLKDDSWSRSLCGIHKTVQALLKWGASKVPYLKSIGPLP